MNNITIGIVARDEVLNNVNLQVVTKNNLKKLLTNTNNCDKIIKLLRTKQQQRTLIIED